MALISFDEVVNPKEWCPSFTVFDNDGNEYEGYWSSIRVDRRTLPEGWHAYDIRESEDGWPGTIEKNYVMVNHSGTFLTKEELPLPEDNTGKAWAIFGEDGWDYSFI